MLGWMNHKLESRLPGETATIWDIQMISFIAESEETKEPLDEGEEKNENASLKLNIQET